MAYFGNDMQERCLPDQCGCLTRSAPAAARCQERVRLAHAQLHTPQSGSCPTHTCCRSTHATSDEGPARKRARETAKKSRQRAALSAERAEADKVANTAARRAARQAARTPAPTPAERQQAQQAARTGMMSAGERMENMLWSGRPIDVANIPRELTHAIS